MSKSVILLVFIYCLMVGVCLSASQDQDQTINISESFALTDVRVQKRKHVILKLDADMISLVEDGSRTIFIGTEGGGKQAEVTITGYDPRVTSKENGSLKSQSVIDRPEIFAITKDSRIWADVKSSKQIVMAIGKLGAAQDSESVVRVSAVSSDSLFADVNDRYLVHVEGVEKMGVITTVSRKKGNHHFKFLFESSEKSHTATITARGGKYKNGAVDADGYFDFLNFHQDRVGFVMDPSDPHYCLNKCDYKIQLSLSHVKILMVYIGEHDEYEVLEGKDHSVGRADRDRVHQGGLSEDEHFSVQHGPPPDACVHADPDRRLRGSLRAPRLHSARLQAVRLPVYLGDRKTGGGDQGVHGRHAGQGHGRR